ncbi:TraG family conjugative transposon ATPase [Puia dinghuensis]|uniref:Transposase n=1 Tax=Puia dinghuensis TaxID=1792502 RepID=A0A8J2UIN9_9BACT|nr:TraG family conjugative transposon ATPase [Puia dinghuensis]GGB23869.1 transposase [Puia dinghuensis]
MRSYQIHTFLPIQEIDNNCLLSRNGDIAIACAVTKQPLYDLSPAEYGRLHETLQKAMELFTYGTIVHFQDIYNNTAWTDLTLPTDTGDILADSSNRHFNGRLYRMQRSFLYITKRTATRRPPDSSLSSLLRSAHDPQYCSTQAEIDAFLAECRQFIDGLNASGVIQLKHLTGEDLMGTMSRTGLLEQYMTLEQFQRAAVLQDVDIDKGEIRVGRKRLVLYTLADAANLPSQCSPFRLYEPYSTANTNYPIGHATTLGPLLDVDHICNLYIEKFDARDELQRLETQRRRLHSMAGADRTNAATAADIDAFLDQAAKPGQWVVRVHQNILGWTEDPAFLPELNSRIITAIHRTGATPHLETVGAPQIWWAGIPGNAGDLPVNETFLSFPGAALCWLIPEGSDPTTKTTTPSGIRLGDRHTGIPVNVDLSDEPLKKGWITNRNKFILGGSGSGKSFFTNLLVRSYHAQRAHIVLLDIGGSYKSLCQLLDGYYFECAEANPIRFNPFLLAEGETLDTEKKESLKALLLTLWKKTDEGFRRSEYVALSNMIEGYYAWLADIPSTTPCFDSFYEWTRDVFQPRVVEVGVRESDFDCRNLLYVLRPYYKGGEYDYLLNATENTDLFHQRLIVFDLDAIKDHPILFPITTIIIMELFTSKMRKLKGVRKVILLEEAWKAIAKEGMSDYVKYLFKTVRKFYGEAIVVTQDIEDIVSSPVVKNAIINNADCKILLDQSKFLNRFDQIQELLGLTEKDKTMVLSLNRANDPNLKYKEVFIGLGADHGRVYRVEVPLEEYLVYTTEEKEKVKVFEYAGQHGSLWKGIDALAADIRSGAVKLLVAALLTGLFLLAPHARASAQVDIIGDAIKEALESADLHIQRLQTKTILLQNAEKALENTMAGDLLDDITGWVQQQKDLYGEYYNELWQVKDAFVHYSKVVTLLDRQAQLVSDYQRATAAVKQDAHFSPGELTHILSVYSGILDASIRDVGRLATVLTGFATQMDDAARLRLLDETAADIDRNSATLRTFTQENSLLSLQRAKDAADIQVIQKLYGL